MYILQLALTSCWKIGIGNPWHLLGITLMTQIQFSIHNGYLILCPWASYQIRKIAGCACAGNAGKVFPHCRFQRKPLVSDPGMHHGTCVTHVPWCMSGSLTCGDGESVPGKPRACAPAILRIWQEAHAKELYGFDFNHHVYSSVVVMAEIYIRRTGLQYFQS